MCYLDTRRRFWIVEYNVKMRLKNIKAFQIQTKTELKNVNIENALKKAITTGDST